MLGSPVASWLSGAASCGWPGLACGLECVHLMECVLHDGVLVLELEVALELPALQQQRQPVLVIGPHVFKGDLVLLEPLRPHLCVGGEKG